MELHSIKVNRLERRLVLLVVYTTVLVASAALATHSNSGVQRNCQAVLDAIPAESSCSDDSEWHYVETLRGRTTRFTCAPRTRSECVVCICAACVQS